MKYMNWLTIAGSVLGMIFGTAGLTLGVLNYRRDRPEVKVTLAWNMVNLQTKKVMGLIKVTNTGRRAVFISVAALEIPNSSAVYVLNDSLSGAKLGEGDKPAAYFVSHDGLAKHSQNWRRIRAFVEVSTGQRYYSSYPRRNEPPPWVK